MTQTEPRAAESPAFSAARHMQRIQRRARAQEAPQEFVDPPVGLDILEVLEGRSERPQRRHRGRRHKKDWALLGLVVVTLYATSFVVGLAQGRGTPPQPSTSTSQEGDDGLLGGPVYDQTHQAEPTYIYPSKGILQAGSNPH